MIKRKTIVMTAMLLIGSWAYSSAQNEYTVLPVEISNTHSNILADTVVRQVPEQLLFRAGESAIDTLYMDNAQRLDLFVQKIKAVLADPNHVVSRIEVVGTVSPDELNVDLAGQRAESFAQYLQLHTAVSLDKIEVIHGGENWAGLRMMIEESESMSHRDTMLHLIGIPDVEIRKHQMMLYANGKPWSWMVENFFDSLRVSSGLLQSRALLDTISRDNWARVRQIISRSGIDTVIRNVSLNVIDNQMDLVERFNQIQALYTDSATFRSLQTEIATELLGGSSTLSSDNWTLLRESIVASTLIRKDSILAIIDNASIVKGREELLRVLESSESYNQLLDLFIPKLLAASNEVPWIQDTSITPRIAKFKMPLIGLKTDLMLWSGVMPGFKMGSWSPNLSAEVHFARSWSAQAGWAFSNWNALAGTKELYAMSVGDLEVRHWFGQPSQFNGFFLGVYGMFGEYDVQNAPTAQTGSFWSVGVGAGWLQKLPHNWAIEAEVRGGYHSAKNNFYDIDYDAIGSKHYYYNHPSTENKFMPSLRLSLVYRIGKPQK